LIRLGLLTGNRHKLEELSAVLKPYGVSLYQLAVGKFEVQSDSIEEIALAAARHAYSQLRVPLIADDSGLFIDSLNGFPGPYSSYAYKTIGIQGILRLLHASRSRRACFRAAIAAVIPPYEKVFTGQICGYIAHEPRGSGGFGFDPIFVPDEGDGRTFAEMSLEEKNSISHRARAARALGEWLLRAFGRQSLKEDRGRAGISGG
jgi:XTP/dITP diphosphohydrolase